MTNPVYIGKSALRSNVLVAPMSGVTDFPFRRVLAQFEPGLVVSEMVASQRLVAGDAENMAKASGKGVIDPLSVQLVGRDPYWMAEGAKALADAGVDIIDINMGCPARKVTGALSGSALMREPKLALKIIEAVVRAVDLPVTLKMRLGWDYESLNAAEIARDAEKAGVVMFVVHGRTRCQFYKGEANWSAVRAVVDAVDRPIFVNGDIYDGEDALAAMAKSKAVGVMVGRSLIGRPWDILNIREAVDGCEIKPLSVARKAEVAVSHYKNILSFYPAKKGIRFARKHLAGYCDQAGLTTSDLLRHIICQSIDPSEVSQALETAFLQIAEAA